jgi:hypothetical protein
MAMLGMLGKSQDIFRIFVHYSVLCFRLFSMYFPNQWFMVFKDLHFTCAFWKTHPPFLLLYSRIANKTKSNIQVKNELYFEC